MGIKKTQFLSKKSHWSKRTLETINGEGAQKKRDRTTKRRRKEEPRGVCEGERRRRLERKVLCEGGVGGECTFKSKINAAERDRKLHKANRKDLLARKS